MQRLVLVFMATWFSALASGCAPLVVGAGGAVIADAAVEDQKGGDGLF
jgi:hypothetical protein